MKSGVSSYLKSRLHIFESGSVKSDVNLRPRANTDFKSTRSPMPIQIPKPKLQPRPFTPKSKDISRSKSITNTNDYPKESVASHKKLFEKKKQENQPLMNPRNLLRRLSAAAEKNANSITNMKQSNKIPSPYKDWEKETKYKPSTIDKIHDKTIEMKKKIEAAKNKAEESPKEKPDIDDTDTESDEEESKVPKIWIPPVFPISNENDDDEINYTPLISTASTPHSLKQISYREEKKQSFHPARLQRMESILIPKEKLEEMDNDINFSKAEISVELERKHEQEEYIKMKREDSKRQEEYDELEPPPPPDEPDIEPFVTPQDVVHSESTSSIDHLDTSKHVTPDHDFGITLNEIIFTFPQLREALKSFLMKKNLQHSLLFIEQVEQYDLEEVFAKKQQLCTLIFDWYIKQDSSLSLRIPEHMIMNIQTAMQSGNFESKLFELARRNVITRLHCVLLPEFFEIPGMLSLALTTKDLYQKQKLAEEKTKSSMWLCSKCGYSNTTGISCVLCQATNTEVSESWECVCKTVNFVTTDKCEQCMRDRPDEPPPDIGSEDVVFDEQSNPSKVKEEEKLPEENKKVDEETIPKYTEISKLEMDFVEHFHKVYVTIESKKGKRSCFLCIRQSDIALYLTGDQLAGYPTSIIPLEDAPSET